MLSPSARIIQILPEEILEEILLRLPVRLLLLLKCVCKSWFSLISSKHFIVAHLKIRKEDTSLDRWSVISDEGWWSKSDNCRKYALRQYSLRSILSGAVNEAIEDGTSEEESPYIVGCCNGIICFFNPNSDCFTLWNPSTRKLRILPALNEEYDKDLSMTRCGFGFDEVNEDYKVVVIRDFSKIHGNPIMKICSLKSNSWKEIEILKKYIPSELKGKFLKNKLHWRKSSNTICSFDLVSETWEKLKVPNFSDPRFLIIRSFGVLWGCLSAFCDCDIGRDVWVLNKDENNGSLSWNKLLTIECPYDEYNYVVPLSVIPSGRFLLYDKWNMSIYDVKDNSLQRVKEIGDAKKIYDVVICVESLVQVE